MSGHLRRDDATGRWRVVGLLTVLSILLLMPTVVIAQQDFSKVEIKTTDLGDGLAMLQGAGGNIGVSMKRTPGASFSKGQLSINPFISRVFPRRFDRRWQRKSTGRNTRSMRMKADSRHKLSRAPSQILYS
jgi:hypothetical protein